MPISIPRSKVAKKVAPHIAKSERSFFHNSTGSLMLIKLETATSITAPKMAKGRLSNNQVKNAKLDRTIAAVTMDDKAAQPPEQALTADREKPPAPCRELKKAAPPLAIPRATST